LDFKFFINSYKFSPLMKHTVP